MTNKQRVIADGLPGPVPHRTDGRFFDHLAKTPIRLGDPVVIEGKSVTHLTYEVVR